MKPKEKVKIKKTKKTIQKKPREIHPAYFRRGKKKSKKPWFHFSKPKVDKRAFIVIAILLFIVSIAFLIFRKDKASEEIIQYAFFSLIIYLVLAFSGRMRGKD